MNKSYKIKKTALKHRRMYETCVFNKDTKRFENIVLYEKGDFAALNVFSILFLILGFVNITLLQDKQTAITAFVIVCIFQIGRIMKNAFMGIHE